MEISIENTSVFTSTSVNFANYFGNYKAVRLMAD
jgi:hypothetical protein